MDRSWSFLNDLSKNNTEILFQVSNKCGIDKNISNPKEVAQIIIDKFNASSPCNNYTDFSKTMINLIKVDSFFKYNTEYNIDLMIMASALLGYLLNDDKLLIQFSIDEGMASRKKDFFKKEFISRFKLSKQFRERIPYYLLAVLGVDKSNIDKASSVSLNMLLFGVTSYATLYSFLSSTVIASLVASSIIPLIPISIILMLTLGVKKILLSSKELIPISLVLVYLHYVSQIAVNSEEEAVLFCKKLIKQDKDTKSLASYNNTLYDKKINQPLNLNDGRINRLFVLYYLFSNSLKGSNERTRKLLSQLDVFLEPRIKENFSTVFLKSLIPYTSHLIDVLIAGDEKNILNSNELNCYKGLQYLFVKYIYPFSPIGKNIYILIDEREKINSIITRLYFEYKGINSDTNCLTCSKIHGKSFDTIIGLDENNFKKYSHLLKENSIISDYDNCVLQSEVPHSTVEGKATKLNFYKSEIKDDHIQYAIKRYKSDIKSFYEDFISCDKVISNCDNNTSQIEPSKDTIKENITSNNEKILDDLEIVKKEIRHNALKYFPRIKKDIKQGNLDRAIEYLERVEEYIKGFAMSNGKPEKLNFLTYFRECFSDSDWDIDWTNTPKEIWVSFSVSELRSCVLNNILNNFLTHAYPKGYAPCGKRIRISVECNETTISIFISNNGLVFEGDKDKIFSLAYKYNSNGEGIGMFSLQNAMKEYGGNVRFECDNISEYPVTYVLTFKRI